MKIKWNGAFNTLAFIMVEEKKTKAQCPNHESSTVIDTFHSLTNLNFITTLEVGPKFTDEETETQKFTNLLT